MTATHEVLNQVPPFAGRNLLTGDYALIEGMKREGAAWALDEATALGERVGSEEVEGWAAAANRNAPVLHTHDARGHRRDEVEFHPSWHSLMELSVSHGLQAAPWADGRAGAHVARAGMFMLMAQAEAGHGCPISMTYSVVPALRHQPELAAQWEPKVVSRQYDRRFRPVAEKSGALMGMAMTEKQGGSDVRANTTRAEADGDGYRLVGHKWFCSAPMCDAFLVLAQAEGGLTCFLLPRFTPDGERNAFHIQRLKDKLGNRSNASSEVEFQGAWAQRVGEEGRGVPTILEMVSHTRLDCVLGSAAGMRNAVARAAHHIEHRSAFGKVLKDQPLMQNVMADLALESEAATLMAMRLAGAFDRRDDDQEQRFRRLATAVSKYWVCKRQGVVTGEALECLGGNGFVEDSQMPRLFRESPLNSIWEGSGNVQALDVLRALNREPGVVDAMAAELGSASGTDRRYDAFIEDLQAQLGSLEDPQRNARRVVGGLALALQASLMLRYAPPAMADAFVASRLAGDWGGTFGTLPAGADLPGIAGRVFSA